jgi:hypothetical protein
MDVRTTPFQSSCLGNRRRWRKALATSLLKEYSWRASLRSVTSFRSLLGGNGAVFSITAPLLHEEKEGRMRKQKTIEGR